MTSAKRPFGLRRARQKGGGPNSMGLTEYFVGASAPSAMYKGDPVVAVSGLLKPATATSDVPTGVADSFRWIDPTTRTPQWSYYLPAGTSSYDSKIFALVNDEPDATFYVQADASVSLGDLNWYQFALSAVGTGGTLNLQSQAVLKVDSRTTAGAAAQYRIVGIAGFPDNAAQDAATVVEVVIGRGREVNVSVV